MKRRLQVFAVDQLGNPINDQNPPKELEQQKHATEGIKHQHDPGNTQKQAED